MGKLNRLAVGYGEEIITPSLGVELCGYGLYPNRRAESVLDDLKVRVLSLSSGEEKVVLISCDLVGFTVLFSDKLRREIASENGLNFQNIVLACIHTHTGPASQFLRAMGKVSLAYLAKLTGKIKRAVRAAITDQKEATVSFGMETIEPIGFNRRNGGFEPVDPVLKVMIFKRRVRPFSKVYLINYACHPVVLGKIEKISADWPGALVEEIEKSGNRAIFFQGFCGDIDPVTNKNRWGRGDQEDLLFYGKLLAQRTFKIERYASPLSKTDLRVREKRINLPVKIPSRKEIELEKQSWLKRYNDNLPSVRFIKDWEKGMKGSYHNLKKRFYSEDIPIQGISIGEVKILGLPGEVFCRYALRLCKRHPQLFTFGYNGGNIGYLPTKDAYTIPNDYACYTAPKIYGLVPFAPVIENLILNASNEVLRFTQPKVLRNE